MREQAKQLYNETVRKLKSRCESRMRAMSSAVSQWRELLRDGEKRELERALAMREQAKELYNETVKKLKSRCESRMRARRQKEGGE